MLRCALLGLLLVVSLQAADFQNGQAARAVIGQSSFSAREAGVSAIALALAPNRLYAADASNHVLTFDLARIPGPKEDMSAYPSGACSLCGFAPLAVAAQAVIPGVAGVSSFGKTVLIVDPVHRHVLIWRDASRVQPGPDLVLGRSESSGVSAAVLVNPVSVAFDGKRVFVGDAGLHRVLVWNSIPASSDQPADVVLGQPDFTSSDVADGPRADTIRLPAALASDGSNLYVADSLDRRILIFTPSDAPLAPGALLNSAALSAGPVAPGTLVTIKGAGLSYRSESAQQDGDASLPLELGGVEAVFNGAPLPLLSISPEEIQAQLPYTIGSASSANLYIRAERPDAAPLISNPIAVPLAPASPGLFAFTGTEPRIGILLHAAGDNNSAADAPVTTDNPASPGEVLTVWAAGLGDVGDPETDAIEGVPFGGAAAPVLVPVSATVNGRSAEVESATLPEGAIGVYQVRILLPADLAADKKARLFLTQHGVSSNTILFPVGQPSQ